MRHRYTSKCQQKRPAIVFLDIKKAFDTVSHNMLIEKLKHYGIYGLGQSWFESFLSDHKELFCLGAKAWNILPQTLRASQTIKSFSSVYKDTLMERVKNDENYKINNRFEFR